MIAFTLIFASLVLAGAFLLAYIFPKVLINKLEQENKEIKNKIALFGDSAALTERLEQKENEFAAKNELITTIQKEKIKVSEVVKKITSFLPEDVYITSLTISEGKTVNIKFLIKDPIDAAKLIVKLKESKLFDNVDAASLPLTKGNTTLSFDLALKKEDPGTQAK